MGVPKLKIEIMETNEVNPNQTSDRIDQLIKTINAKDLAKYLRVYQQETTKMYLACHDADELVTVDRKAIADGNHWLTEVCEALEPYLSE